MLYMLYFFCLVVMKILVWRNSRVTGKLQEYYCSYFLSPSFPYINILCSCGSVVKTKKLAVAKCY